MHSAATPSSSTTIACIRFPAATRIAVSYFDSLCPSREDRRDRNGVPALQALRDVRLRLHGGVLAGEVEDRGLELPLLPGQLGLLLPLRVEVRLEPREALRGGLRAGPELLELELRVVELELVRLQDVLQLDDPVPD